MTHRWQRWIQFRLRTLLAALVLSGIGLGLFRSTRVVPVAKTKIEAGLPVKAKSIQWQRRFLFQIPADAYFDTDDFAVTVAARRPIEAGEVLTHEKLTEPGQVGICSGIFSTVRAHTIALAPVQVDYDWPVPRSHVDVLLTVMDDQGGQQTEPLMQTIEVLAVGDPLTHESRQRNVTLRVTIHQSARLQFASTQGMFSLVQSEMNEKPRTPRRATTRP